MAEGQAEDVEFAAISLWVIRGGVGHAVRETKPKTVAYCGEEDFRGGQLTADRPDRICVDCRFRLQFFGPKRLRLVQAGLFGEGDEE